MRNRTPKRVKQEREYRKLRDAFLAENPWCRRCGALSTEVHHGRGRRGEDLLRVEWWRALCHDCHTWAGENPAAAIASGISLPRIGLIA